ncbi:MAG: hypothetical protein IJM79_03700 [Erysipelotrichaceae bacterium]|nr:hypothetical protein [Erysipelotrichaceae bacterium]
MCKKLDQAIRKWLYGNNEEIMQNEGEEIAKSFLFGNIGDTTHKSQRKRNETLNEMFGDHKDSHESY